jgi:hypothetical protein
MSLGYNENQTAAVPASLIVDLAGKFYADKEADRVLARDMMSQLAQIGTILVGMAAKMEEERRHERREERRAR